MPPAASGMLPRVVALEMSLRKGVYMQSIPETWCVSHLAPVYRHHHRSTSPSEYSATPAMGVPRHAVRYLPTRQAVTAVEIS